MSAIIGIDFGTTKSTVGAWVDGKPYIIKCKNGKRSIPSEILVHGKDGKQDILVGWETRTKNKYGEDSYIVKSIKRMAGIANYKNENWWYKYPQYTIGYILAELKSMAEDHLKQEVKEAVITIPIHFDLNQRRSILDGAKIARLKVKRLLNEPTASVIEFVQSNNKEQTFLVIDIGGGTTDIAIIEYGDNVFEIKYVDGKTQLGGVDYTNVLFNWLLIQLNKKYDIKRSQINKTVEVFLFDELERVKLELSDNKTSKIHLPSFLINKQFLDEEFVLTQSKFKELTNKLNTEIVKMSKALSKQFNNKIDVYLLMGGASRVFGLKEMLKEELETSSIRKKNFETSVAKGATTLAASIILGENNCLVIDRLQDDYGIGLENNKYEIILKKNHTIPTNSMKIFTTSEDNQTAIIINVYKGHNPTASKNKLIGQLHLLDIPPAPKGIPEISVEFDVNSNMEINVTAKNRATGKSISSKLKSRTSLSEKQINEFQKKVDKWQEKRKARNLIID